MRHVKHLKWVFLLIFVFTFLPCFSLAEIIPQPVFSGYVYDYADVISATDETLINTYAKSVDSMGSGTVIALTVSSLDGMDASDYGVQIFNEWGIGSAELNDGVLILLAPNERAIQIITGSGIDSQMTDEMCGQIIDAYGLEYLALNQFSAGMRELAKAVCLKMALMRSPLLDDFQQVLEIQAL